MILLSLQPLLHSAEDKKLTVYSTGKSYQLAVTDVEKQEYASLADLLQPLGKFEQHASHGTFRFRLNNVEGEFSEGKKLSRVGPTQLLLPAKAVVDHGKLLVPLPAMPGLLEKFLGQKADLHAAGRRLFIGDAGQRFKLEIKRPDDNLVITFPAQVAPSVSSEPGKVRLLFTKDPILFWADSITYTDKLFTSARFIERNGTAEIEINATAPLTASVADGGKTILISAAPQVATAATAPPSPSAPVTAPAATQPSPSPAATPQQKITAPSATVPFFVMIDPSHGGDEPGARFSDKLFEKDITLAIARKLRTELRDHGITAVLLRDSDATLNYDQRAVTTNAQRAGMYISIHAGVPGAGVRVYTAMPATIAPPGKTNGKPNGPFVPWEDVQQGYLSRSQTMANALVTELSKAKIASASAAAPLLPLNNIAAPAVAIEVAPPQGESKIESLSAAKYQQTIAAAAAAAIADVRGKLEERR